MPANFSIKYSSCYYACRSYAFVCEYEELLDKISKNSIPFPKNNNHLYLDSFIKEYFNNHEYSLSKNVVQFDYANDEDKSVILDKCKKADFSIFLLDSSTLADVFKKEQLYKNAQKAVISVLNVFLESKQLFYGLAQMSEQNFENIITTYHNQFSLFKSFDDTIMLAGKERNFHYIYNSFISFLSIIKNNTVYLTKDKSNVLDKYETISKEIKKVTDLFYAMGVMCGDCYVVAFVSSLGALNVAVVNEEEDKLLLPTEPYDSENANELVKCAIEESEKICSRINRIPRSFSFLNLNEYLGFENFYPIIENVSPLLDPHAIIHETNDIIDKTNTYKAIYLKILCNDTNRNKKDESPMIFYDYLSLLVAFQHRFDQYTLWTYLNNKDPYASEFKNVIVDHIHKATEHLYFDDSMALLSVIDQQVNSTRLASLNKDILDVLPKASHQVRVYSFWDFMYSCSALSFGSLSLLIDNLMIKHVKEIVINTHFKPSINKKLIRLAYMNSRIHAMIGYASFNAKQDSQPIIDAIFSEIGLLRIEKYLKDSTEVNWKSGELINTQTYHRYGLIFSISSLLITLFAFGWVSRIDDVEKSEFSFEELFKGIFTTPKVLVVLGIIMIPAVGWVILNILDLHYIKCKLRNVPATCGFTRKMRTVKQKTYCK